MIVLKSTFDKAAKLAKEACISRDLWRHTAKTNGAALKEVLAERDALQARALAAEGEIARRRAHAKSNLRQYQAKDVEQASAGG
jgi:hypothetical protein